MFTLFIDAHHAGVYPTRKAAKRAALRINSAQPHNFYICDATGRLRNAWWQLEDVTGPATR